MRETYPNELYHHGIEGQKWGIRRYQNPNGTLTEAGRRRYNGERPTRQDKKEQKAAIKEINADRKAIAKTSAYLSDKEVKQYIERLKLEQELRDLTKENTKSGKSYIKDLLKDAGSDAAKKILTNIAGEIGTSVGKSLGEKLSKSISEASKKEGDKK